MIFFESPEQEIVAFVEQGPAAKKKLITSVAKQTSRTPQQIYRVLNKLISYGVLIENNKVISFSGSYLIKLRHYYLKISQSYANQESLHNFIPELQQKSKASITFTYYRELSQLWDHLGVLLKSKSSESRPYFFVENYSYWLRYFYENSTGYLTFMKSHGYNPVWVCKSAANDAVMDDIKQLRSLGVEVIFNDTLDLYTGYNIFDDYVIEINYEPSWFSMIHEAYLQNVSPELAHKLFDEPSQFKLTVYKNAKKFEPLIKKLTKEIL